MSNKEVSSGFYADLVNRLFAHLDYLQFYYRKLRDSPQKIEKLVFISKLQKKWQINPAKLNREVKGSEMNYN